MDRNTILSSYRLGILNYHHLLESLWVDKVFRIEKKKILSLSDPWNRQQFKEMWGLKVQQSSSQFKNENKIIDEKIENFFLVSPKEKVGIENKILNELNQREKRVSKLL